MVECETSILDQFRYTWMREYYFFDILNSQLSFDQGRSAPDHLTRIRAQDMNAKDGTGLFTADNFHKTGTFLTMFGQETPV